MGWFDDIPTKYRAVAALVGAFLAGAFVAVAAAGFLGIPGRVEHLERVTVKEADSVTEPLVDRIEVLEERMDGLSVVIRQVNELYCGQFPDRCEGVPRRSMKGG